MRIRILIILFCFLGTVVDAQESRNIDNTDLTQKRTAKLIEYSDHFLKVQDSLWFVGKEYKFINTNSTGTPFFFDEIRFKGTLIFNGIKYTDLTLFYDLVKDALVLHHASKNLGFVFIHLNKEWIQEFTLDNNGSKYDFIPGSYLKNLDKEIPEGFYELVYDNDLMLLFKNSKKISFEAFDNSHNKYTFTQTLYLIDNNKVFDITKKSDFLSAFEDKKKQIRTYLRHSGIIYRNASRSELISIIKYCETLS